MNWGFLNLWSGVDSTKYFPKLNMRDSPRISHTYFLHELKMAFLAMENSININNWKSMDIWLLLNDNVWILGELKKKERNTNPGLITQQLNHYNVVHKIEIQNLKKPWNSNMYMRIYI